MPNDVKPDECSSPQDCIAKVYQVLDTSRSSGQSPSNEELAIIVKLLTFGENAMPYIVDLLADDDKLIARIGAVALRKAKSIDQKYLPQMIKALEADVSWLAPALATIGTPKAAEATVKKYLIASSSPHNQESYALKLFGENAFPAILKAAKCEFGCDARTYYLLGYVLGRMEEDREQAANLLIKLLDDKTLPESVWLGVLEMISFLDKPGLVIEDKLLKIKETTPRLADAVNQALIGIKSKHSGKIYADIFNINFDRSKLVNVAYLGLSGYEAGETIIRGLGSSDSETQVLSARTLGFIGYTPAANRLIELLNDHSNVKLNWVAADALGRMKSKLAEPALKIIAEVHWYPPVKEAAKKAIQRINDDEHYKAGLHKNNFVFDFYNYGNFDLQVCEKIALEPIVESKDKKLYRHTSAEKLKSLAYSSFIISYGANNEAEQKATDPNATIVVNKDNIVEHRKQIKQVPKVALRGDGGWLAGSNRGEWGGELVYIADKTSVTKILDRNVEDIYEFGTGYIATTGLAHLGQNNGIIYQLLHKEDGPWQTTEWIVLPGAPRSSWFVETGELLINTHNGGSILLSQDGSMRMASCK